VGDFVNDVRNKAGNRRLRIGAYGTDAYGADGPRRRVGYAYTYLVNGTTPAGNWTGLFRRGEKVRLRVINGSSMTFFDIRIPGLKLTVVAADGQDVDRSPSMSSYWARGSVRRDRRAQGRSRLHALRAIDRPFGYARGTLAPQPGMQAEVPPLDARPLLTMMDMGMVTTWPAWT